MRILSAGWAGGVAGQLAAGWQGRMRAPLGRIVSRRSVPILCYHSISDRPKSVVDSFGTPVKAFERQMKLLARLGYRTCTVREIAEALARPEPMKFDLAKPVVITFDDGYEDVVTTALPILASYGFRATVYVIPDLVGGNAEWLSTSDTENGVFTLATWDALRSLEARGWEIGFHTSSHRDLTVLGVDELEDEVDRGLRDFAQHMGTPAYSAAYPFGWHSPESIAAMRRAGVQAAVAVAQSRATARANPFTIPRTMVKRNDTLLDFLLTGYRVRGFGRYLFRASTRSRGYRRQTPRVAKGQTRGR